MPIVEESNINWAREIDEKDTGECSWIFAHFFAFLKNFLHMFI